MARIVDKIRIFKLRLKNRLSNKKQVSIELPKKKPDLKNVEYGKKASSLNKFEEVKEQIQIAKTLIVDECDDAINRGNRISFRRSYIIGLCLSVSIALIFFPINVKAFDMLQKAQIGCLRHENAKLEEKIAFLESVKKAIQDGVIPNSKVTFTKEFPPTCPYDDPVVPQYTPGVFGKIITGIVTYLSFVNLTGIVGGFLSGCLVTYLIMRQKIKNLKS